MICEFMHLCVNRESSTRITHNSHRDLRSIFARNMYPCQFVGPDGPIRTDQAHTMRCSRSGHLRGECIVPGRIGPRLDGRTIFPSVLRHGGVGAASGGSMEASKGFNGWICTPAGGAVGSGAAWYAKRRTNVALSGTRRCGRLEMAAAARQERTPTGYLWCTGRTNRNV